MKSNKFFLYIIYFTLLVFIFNTSSVFCADKKEVGSSPGQGTIHLTWKDLGAGIAYQFQMSKDKGFQKILIDKKCEKPELTFSTPDVPGTYYFRTKPIYQDGTEGAFSPAQSYEISAILQPPLIITPPERAEFRNINDIEFNWNKVPGAAKYHVILARDRTFKQIVYENTNVAETSVTIMYLDYGPHFFKISSIAQDGSEGPFSDTLTFIITPPPPVKIEVK